jgi:hypothetical protein
MATLPKVLINQADSKSAGGVALRVRTQDLLDQHVHYLKADADDLREQANHDMRFVLRSAFQLLRAARVTKLELIVRASAAEPRPQQAAWAGSRPSASTPRREV